MMALTLLERIISPGKIEEQFNSFIYQYNETIRYLKRWGTEAEKQYWTLSINGMALDDTYPLAIALRPGYITQITAASIVIAGANSSSTIDVQKNATSCLNAVITLGSTAAARTPVAGTLTTTASVLQCDKNDFFEVVVVASGPLPPRDVVVTVEWIPFVI